VDQYLAGKKNTASADETFKLAPRKTAGGGKF
jgi:hypothetical protein